MEHDVPLALAEARPVVAFEQDWRDVLDRADLAGDVPRATGRRWRLPTAALAVLAAAVALAAPALGLDRTLRSFFDLSSGRDLAPSWRQAGPAVRPGPSLLAAAHLTHVDAATLRRIGAAGAGARRLIVIGGIGADGRAWIGQTGDGWVSDFFPLFGDVGQVANRYTWRPTAAGWQGTDFPMYARSDEHRGLFAYTLYGGDVPGRTTWATIVGFARDGVARVAIRTASGARLWLSPDASGGFSYAATAPGRLPVRIESYDAAGRAAAIAPLDLKPYTG